MQETGVAALELYTGPNLTGRKFVVSNALNSLSVDSDNFTILSCRVISGAWMLHADGDSQGKMAVLKPGVYNVAETMDATNGNMTGLRLKWELHHDAHFKGSYTESGSYSASASYSSSTSTSSSYAVGTSAAAYLSAEGQVVAQGNGGNGGQAGKQQNGSPVPSAELSPGKW